MPNRSHCSVLLDHKMIVDGVLMKEKKDLTKRLNKKTGVEESHLRHMRVIGNRSYTAKQTITDGEEKEEIIETKMDICELLNFKKEWQQKWKAPANRAPARIIREDEPRMFGHLFTMLNPFNWWNPSIREEFTRFFKMMNPFAK